MEQAKKGLQKSGYEGKEKVEANLILSYIFATEDYEKAKQTLKLVDSSEYMTIYYEEFAEVLESLDEDNKFNATKLARIFINNGYPYLAIQLLQPMKEDISEYLEGMYFLGRAYFDYGEYEKAIETLDGALTLGGMETDILWTKARAYFLQNDLDNTTKSYDSAIGYAGSEISLDLVNEYIDILLENNQVLKANTLVKDLLAKYPDIAYLNILAVKTHTILKEDVKVEYYLSELEELQLEDSEKIEYLELKIQFLLEKGENIDEYLVELEELDRFNPCYQFYLAKLQIEEGEEELAIQSLERAIEYDLEYEITEEASKLLSSLR
jgi:tetratricopeptide (TPR) repeat protein